jgi:hypothetical protein
MPLNVFMSLKILLSLDKLASIGLIGLSELSSRKLLHPIRITNVSSGIKTRDIRIRPSDLKIKLPKHCVTYQHPL